MILQTNSPSTTRTIIGVEHLHGFQSNKSAKWHEYSRRRWRIRCKPDSALALMPARLAVPKGLLILLTFHQQESWLARVSTVICTSTSSTRGKAHFGYAACEGEKQALCTTQNGGGPCYTPTVNIEQAAASQMITRYSVERHEQSLDLGCDSQILCS